MTRTAPFGLGPPPTREPVQVTREMALRGKPVRVSTPEGFWEGRAFTDPVWRDVNGRTWSARPTADTPTDADLASALLRVGVCSEMDWLRWRITGRWPHVEYWRASAVWVDMAR